MGIAANGSLYFKARVINPSGQNIGLAVLKQEGGEVTVEIAPGQVIDGASLGNFEADVTDVNGAGDFVVRTDVGGGDLIKSVGGDLSAVILNGGMAPGIDDPLGFFSNADINANGDVAFFATNRDNAACNAIVECGIFAEMNGELGLVAKRGDTIEIAPDDFRTISVLGISERGGFLNDLGQIAFLAMFSGPDNPGLGDTQAWIIASPTCGPAPIPLPASGLLLIAGIASLTIFKTRRRESLLRMKAYRAVWAPALNTCAELC
ncbi:MAG: VPLPA-CTERM sorting domain-containing protein [Pseudomonadota bacterium]